MSEKITSQGRCVFCNKFFAKSSLVRHLTAHIEEKMKGGSPGKSFQIKIETAPRWGGSGYFLNIWVDGNTTFGRIDTFLRQIWLECCDHLSAFQLPRKRNVSPINFLQEITKGKHWIGMESEFGEIPMSMKVKDILHKDLKLDYDYDFGSTTELQLTIVAEYATKADQPLVLLSRNEPLGQMCEACGKKPATQMCSVCVYNAKSMFCETCAKKHAKTCSDFDDYAAMRVVNSPRMGVCAYEGGSIDTERDGMLMKKNS
jgi:hypothetical protein